MNESLSIFDLFVDASFLVQLIMLFLLGVSVYSWSLIATKIRELKSAREDLRAFEDEFWNSADLSVLYKSQRSHSDSLTGAARLFDVGFAEYSRLLKATDGGAPLLDAVQRVMRIALQREVDRLEAQLSILATIGSVSPYVGLFGTVWGIMNAFIGLSGAQNVTLAVVAPGIAEALIATAIGLFAAIPAVVAYNRFVTELDRQTGRLESYTEEFLGLLHRQVHARSV